MKTNHNKITKYQSGNVILKQTQQLGALVLGDCNSAMDKKIQKEWMIQTVISIGQQAMPIKEKLPQNCKHFFYDIHDNKSQKITIQLFDQINKLIQEGRKQGGVLVHCYAGVSRSSTFVIAYYMQKFNKNFDAARQQVKKGRNCIYPNDGFIHHLKNYSNQLQKREQQRLRKIQELKKLQMSNSLVKSARKSIRGGVKSADISLQKVKQMQEQKKKSVYQVIVDFAENQIEESSKGLKQNETQPKTEQRKIQLTKPQKNNLVNSKTVDIKNRKNQAIVKIVNKTTEVSKIQTKVNDKSVKVQKKQHKNIKDQASVIKNNLKVQQKYFKKKENDQVKKKNKINVNLEVGYDEHKIKQHSENNNEVKYDDLKLQSSNKQKKDVAQNEQKLLQNLIQAQQAEQKKQINLTKTKQLSIASKQDTLKSSSQKQPLNNHQKQIKRIYQTKIRVK